MKRSGSFGFITNIFRRNRTNSVAKSEINGVVQYDVRHHNDVERGKSYDNNGATHLEFENGDASRSNANSMDQSHLPAAEKTVCHFEESPFHILKVAAQGVLEDVQQLVNENNERLGIRDYRGQNVFHHAVAWSRIAVLDYLYEFIHLPHVDMNAQDKLGNTPLHHAIERGQLPAIKWLLKHGADLRIKNNNSAAPIHQAVELNRLDIVQMIVEHDHECVYQPGDFGFTPLHYACINDLPSIARLLLNEGADIFQNCDIGYSAIHAATRNGAAKVVDVLIEFAEGQGISGETLIHTLDKEKNFPLHSAVNSGDLKAVKVCLKAGADINAQHSEDKQTAVHYAAAKGSVDILKLMFEAQRDKIETCLHCRDILEQTPLHKAAMFNHVDVVELLLNEGASINPQDAERRTPLLLASSKGALKVVNFLLQRRANTNIRDKDNRNFLHMAILTGLKLKDMEINRLKNLKILLNERDDFGCCPVHYASRAGQLSTVKSLLELGAQVTLKDNEKQSPLHFAAKYGRLQTCKNLLNSEQGALLINEFDQDGRTPLLIAAMFGHYKVIALLVRKGSQMTKDFQQNTALHMAAEYGHHEAVVLLVGLAPHLLNAANKQENTALHLAAQNGHALVVDYLMSADAEFLPNSEGATFFDLAVVKFQPDVAAAIIRHQRCEEAMQLRSVLGSPIIGLIQHLPKICILFLDKCITYSASNKKSRDFYIHYDFTYLQTPEHMAEEQNDSGFDKSQPLLPLNMMVRHNRVDCLAHPLCVSFLNNKWSSYGALMYNLRTAIYILFLGLLTSVVYDVDSAVGTLNCFHHSCQVTDNATSPSNRSTSPLLNSTMKSQVNSSSGVHAPAVASDYQIIQKVLSERGLVLRMVLVTLFCCFNLVLQSLVIFEQKLTYFLDFTNYMELSLYISTFFMTIPSIVQREDMTMQFVASVISVFLGWVNLLLYMQRYDFFGIYIVMFVEIFKTVIRVFIVFSFIIVAFALTLTVAFRTTNGPSVEFNDPFIAMIATMSMMLGELNYIKLITPTVSGEQQLLFPDLAYIVYVAFIVVIPILLTNLLVGLAVGNIESVQKNARLKRLAMQVDFFTALEDRLPNAFLKRHLVSEYTFYPNRAGYWLLEMLKSALTKTSGSENADEEDEGGKTDFAYLLEELTMQSRNLTGLSSKFDNQQELLKVILQKMDTELSHRGKVGEPDNESGEDDNISLTEKNTSQNQNSNEFHSPAARAQWHAVTTRFAAFKKPKANQLWRTTTSEDEEEDALRMRRATSVTLESNSSTT